MYYSRRAPQPYPFNLQRHAHAHTRVYANPLAALHNLVLDFADQVFKPARVREFSRPYWFADHQNSTAALPARTDLRETTCFPYPRVEDQRAEGTCVSHALSAAYQCVQRREKVPFSRSVQPAPDYNYANARALMTRTARENIGVTFESALTDMMVGTLPQSVYAQRRHTTSADHGVREAHRLGHSEQNIKTALAGGYPVLIGFRTTDAIQAWQDDDVAMAASDHVMPSPRSGNPFTGAHAVMLVGYNDATRLFTVRNSWGHNWGLDGHFYMRYADVLNPAITQDVFFIKSTV